VNYETFLQRVIDDGLAAAHADYDKPQQAQLLKGSVDGFEACRGIAPHGLVELWERAGLTMRDKPIDEHWYWRGYQNEVEWVMNCVSAVLQHEGKPPLLAWLPTARAYLKAAEVLGVREGVAR
jgi:hypothetical protein